MLSYVIHKLHMTHRASDGNLILPIHNAFLSYSTFFDLHREKLYYCSLSYRHFYCAVVRAFVILYIYRDINLPLKDSQFVDHYSIDVLSIIKDCIDNDITEIFVIYKIISSFLINKYPMNFKNLFYQLNARIDPFN